MTEQSAAGVKLHPYRPLLTVIAYGEPETFARLASSVTDPRVEFIRASERSASRNVDYEDESSGSVLDRAMQAATGEYIYFAQQDSEMLGPVLAKVLDILADDPDVGVLYTDHAVLPRGQRRPWLVEKPVYSPERLRGQNYYGETVFYRTAIVREIAWPSLDVPGAELYDLALRASARARKVVHLQNVLTVFTENVERPGALRSDLEAESTRVVLERYMSQSGGGVVKEVNRSGLHDTRRLVSGSPLVSIVIPTRGSHGMVRGVSTCLVVEAVESILSRTTYDNYELVVVMDDVVDPEVVDALTSLAGEKLNLVWWRRPFSFSAKVNFGAFHAAGDYLLFLNDDTEVISPGWIEAMLALGQRPQAGLVGSMLYFEDNTIQHAGHIYEGGDAGHIGMFLPRGSEGPLGSFRIEREILGVTAACSLVSRSVFEQAGGFSLLLPGNFNDVDLCLKINLLGYTSYWTPHAELYHYESKSRDARVAQYEVDTANSRWHWKLDDRSYWPYGIWADDHIG